MVGFFPDPYPDELLYSVCARYHHRVRYRAHRATAQDLFGARVVTAIDLTSSAEIQPPSGLDACAHDPACVGVARSRPAADMSGAGATATGVARMIEVIGNGCSTANADRVDRLSEYLTSTT